MLSIYNTKKKHLTTESPIFDTKTLWERKSIKRKKKNVREVFCCAIYKTKVNLRRLYDKTGVINIMNDKRIWKRRPKQNNEHMCLCVRVENPKDVIIQMTFVFLQIYP